ncbi:hypothetical protein AAFF_G00033290 [Aldrovandia affinis]|uniref:Uncharacterized protein n=1 Tax=Aldrovandia affinis TaxID=143900 RepID=A0AAD7S3K9_9TELE|nr:hypothetical protein AAFF_G00033290 [Aldrovandia affinis]
MDGLQDSLDQRFQHLGILGAFSVLKPEAVNGDYEGNIGNLEVLGKHFLQEPEATVLQEWNSHKQHVLVGSFKGMDQLSIMGKLAYQNDDWGQLYPLIAGKDRPEEQAVGRASFGLHAALNQWAASQGLPIQERAGGVL